MGVREFLWLIFSLAGRLAIKFKPSPRHPMPSMTGHATESRAQPAARRWPTLLTLIFGVLCFSGCASLPPPKPSAPTYAMADVAGTTLARIAAANTPADVGDGANKSGLRMLPEGPFSLNARITLARRAEKTLDVQYYQLQSDGVGLRLLRELRDAAKRGVRVRLLVDDFYTAGQDELFTSLAAFPNIQVRLFNPLPARKGSFATRFLASAHEFSRINHRMHNKLFIADNVFSVAGGRNIGDEYFMQSAKENFVDADVLANGEVVQDQSAAFDLYWNSEQVYPLEQVVRPSLPPEQAQVRFNELVADLGPDVATREHDVFGRTTVERQLDEGRLVDQFWAKATVFVDPPSKISAGKTSDERFAGSVTSRVLQIMATAQRSILMISPYIVPGKRGMPYLRASADKGVKMTVYTNSLAATDEPLVYLAYAQYRDDMLRLGMNIYEISPKLGDRTHLGEFGASTARLHAKLLVIDDDRFFIGSMNLDSRSARLNTEIGMLITSPEVVSEFRRLIPSGGFESAYHLRLSRLGTVEWVEHDDAGKDIVHYDEPETSWFAKLSSWMSSLFVSEDDL